MGAAQLTIHTGWGTGLKAISLSISLTYSLCLSTHPPILRARIKEPEKNEESHLVMHIERKSGTVRLCAARIVACNFIKHMHTQCSLRVATKTTRHSSPHPKHSWPKTQHTVCECMWMRVCVCERERVGMWVFVCLITVLGSAWYGLCVF